MDSLLRPPSEDPLCPLERPAEPIAVPSAESFRPRRLHGCLESGREPLWGPTAPTRQSASPAVLGLPGELPKSISSRCLAIAAGHGASISGGNGWVRNRGTGIASMVLHPMTRWPGRLPFTPSPTPHNRGGREGEGQGTYAGSEAVTGASAPPLEEGPGPFRELVQASTGHMTRTAWPAVRHSRTWTARR